MAPDVFGCLFQWIIVDMCVAFRGPALRMTQKLANDREAKTGSGSHRRVSVPQIMESDARQARARGNSFPRLFEIGARAINRRSRDGIFANLGQRVENR